MNFVRNKIDASVMNDSNYTEINFGSLHYNRNSFAIAVIPVLYLWMHFHSIQKRCWFIHKCCSFFFLKHKQLKIANFVIFFITVYQPVYQMFVLSPIDKFLSNYLFSNHSLRGYLQKSIMLICLVVWNINVIVKKNWKY